MICSRRMVLAIALVVGALGTSGCYGTSSAYVGVYGAPVYGPAPWGAYPYPGRYPPVGGGVWVGVCCDEEQQEQLDDQQTPDGPAAQPDLGTETVPDDAEPVSEKTPTR